MTNTAPAHLAYGVEALLNTLRDLAANLRQYGSVMSADARTARVEAYNWHLAELAALHHADRAHQMLAVAKASDLGLLGISYPSDRMIALARTTWDIRASVKLLAEIEAAEELAYDDRMSGPDDDRPHPDGA
jgi:hypothetical protein